MLKAKHSAKRKINSQRRKKTLTRRGLLLIVALMVSLPLGSYIENHYSDQHASPSSAALAEPVGQDHHSLDLKIAKSISYANQRISVYRDLRVKNGVRNYLISFQVPKDGLTEYGYMTLPASDSSNSSYPTIILCHGYVLPVSYSTVRTYLSDMVFYSQHGYAVIKPDFRGQGLSLSHGSPEGAFFSMAYNTDLMSLIAAVKQTSYLDQDSIHLWGHSMGAYIALRAAVISPDIKSAVLVSLPADITQAAQTAHIASSDKGNYVADKVRRQQLSVHGQPLENREFWESTAPLNYLKDTKAYLQIHIGSADRVTSPAISANLDKALTGLNKPHGYFVYPSGRHGLLLERPAIWQRSLSILSLQ